MCAERSVPKCRSFEVPKLNDVREMLGDEIDEGLEAEFKEAERKLKEYAKARAAKKALLEREAAEKAEREAAEKAEREAAEKAEREAAEKAEREAAEKAEREAAEKAESEEEMIVFLCPNGHELSAPASRAGRKGKCPDCGAKFIVPTPEMLAEAKAEAESQKKDESAGHGSGIEPR